MDPKKRRAAGRQPSFDIESALSYRISSLYARLSGGTTQELAGFDLALREWRVMAILARHEPMAAAELVARSPLDKASVSRAVASLEAKGLLSVAPSSGDARRKELRLTADGWALYSEVAPHAIARQKALVSSLTTSERAALVSMLDRIERQIDLYYRRTSE